MILPRFGNSYEIGVIGAGGWGTALAKVLAENGHKVTMWAFEDDVKQEINSKQSNTAFLPDIKLPPSIKAVKKAKKLHRKDIYLIATPTQYIRAVLSSLDFGIKQGPLVNVAKGIEKESLLRISEMILETTDVKISDYCVLSGPSHAEEVARRAPTTVVAASENRALAEHIQKIFMSDYFRIYTSDDVIGCEIGGSLKNVIAIAAGIVDGLGFGDNTKAALITRGVAEISRLGIALGANSQTFSGLSGLGDLFVTCNSKHSRNRRVGELIGRGLSLKEILGKTRMVAEGVETTQSAYKLGVRHGVELPITEQVFNILFKNLNPVEAIKSLMNRQSKREWWW